MKHTLTRGLIPVCLTLLAISFGLLIASCNDSAVSEIELPEQSSLDTPESYLKAIAKAQTNLVAHASSAMREMDEEEFEKVMRNAEKVLERSPVFESFSIADEDFEVKKFSEEEYVMQGEWYEENRDDFLDALSPIFSPEIMGEIAGLMNEFLTVYGTADMDTTGYRAIMQKASQDALAYEAGSCSSPQQITVNQASILPMPSIATIMGWFQGSEAQAVCKSCCIECCNCSAGCDQDLYRRIGVGFSGGVGTFIGCITWTWWSGPISWGGCTFSGLAVTEFWLARAIFMGFRCMHKCKERPDCQQCPTSHYQYQHGTSCETAYTWN